MTDTRLFPSTNGPSTSLSSGTSFIFGIGFEVTSPGLYWKGVWWWIAPDGQNTAAQTIGLWQETGNGTGSYIAGSETTGPAMTAGQWNLITAATPVALTSGQAYRAVITATPGGGNRPFSDTAGVFTSGSTYGNGISNPPLLGFSDGSTGGTNKDPTGTGQCTNFSGGTDVTTQYPATTSHSLYWLDVEVGPVAAPAGSPLLVSVFP